MEKIWEFFEKLDEMVYVSDIETHQIVYMNQRLRDALGYSTQEEYVGKMCYQVLQGCDAPCAFCNNQQLRPGEFLSWTHSNPVLNKRFLIKDSFACHQFGKTVCVEGVEYEEQNQVILNTGCDLIQGYYYYHPMELSDIYRLVSQSAQDGPGGKAP